LEPFFFAVGLGAARAGARFFAGAFELLAASLGAAALDGEDFDAAALGAAAA